MSGVNCRGKNSVTWIRVQPLMMWQSDSIRGSPIQLFLVRNVNIGEGVPVCLANLYSHHACMHYVQMVERSCLRYEDDEVAVPSAIDDQMDVLRNIH